jgi:hypothetical protein
MNDRAIPLSQAELSSGLYVNVLTVVLPNSNNNQATSNNT